jgi:hypothetical protein
MNWYRKILHLLLPAILLAVIPLAQAIGQVTTIYTGQKVNLGIETQPKSRIKWEVYCDSTVNFATTPGNCTKGEADFVNGIDNQTDVQLIFNEPGIYFVKAEVWDSVTCTNNMNFIRLVVDESLPTGTLDLLPNEICVNEPSILSITLTGTPLWGFVIEATNEKGEVTDRLEYNNIDTSQNPFDIIVTPTETTYYRVVKVTDMYGTQNEPSEAVKLTVHPLPTNSRIYLKQ